MIIGSLINIILNPILIFVFDFGIKGSAYATIISQAISSAWVLAYFLGSKSTLKLRAKNLSISIQIVKDIIAIGMAPFTMQIAASVIVIIINKKLAIYGGDAAIAAMGIINSISMLILMPVFGINQGVQPIIGYNYGAKKLDRVRKALKLAIIAATTVSTLGFIVVFTIPRLLMSIFTKSDIALINIGTVGIKMVLVMLPIIGFQVVSASYFQAIGKAKHSMFLSLSRQVLFLIPLLLILPSYLKLNGVWLACSISDLLSSVVTAIFIKVELGDRHL